MKSTHLSSLKISGGKKVNEREMRQNFQMKKSFEKETKKKKIYRNISFLLRYGKLIYLQYSQIFICQPFIAINLIEHFQNNLFIRKKLLSYCPSVLTNKFKKIFWIKTF